MTKDNLMTDLRYYSHIQFFFKSANFSRFTLG